MKKTKHLLAAALCALLLLALILTAPPAHAEYRDGTYEVPFSIGGLGRHNVAWPTATVTVEGGRYYLTFTIERVDPRTHAPQYDWLSTDCGTFTPSLNDAAFTCTFSGVEVSHLGSIAVTAQTSGMSQPYEVDYTLYVDDSAIPQTGSAAASGDTAAPGGSQSSAQSGTPAAQGTTAAPAPQVTLPDKPTQALPGDAIEPEAPGDLLIAPAPGGAPEEAPAESPAETAPAESPAPSGVLYIIIAIVALAAVAGVVLGFRRGKKKGE
ncbi:MAG: hypothetical protein IJS55_00580 [Oscillospiraceae bacterium]|nr:hypothetical protein [Oscillospiraceae bacterium]MBR0211618.1 hypothetical protein [Oscillospiraceae bacterium]